jgi:ornithine cyclodeaminase/alanine dehydrogenase-like protein (mu-crystallin family)
MSALILTRTDVASLLTLDECITVVERAFRDHGLGTALAPDLLSFHADRGAFHVKAAGVTTPRPYFAAKVNGNFPANRERFGLPTIQGLIVLADLTNGTPLAVMDSIEITIQRTGAATAVAAKYLAGKGPAVVTVVGCGLQGRVQLLGVAAVRPIVRIYAFDADPAVTRRFAMDMAPVVGVPIQPVDDVRQALRESDIVVTCTTARTPVVHHGDIKAGAFVAAVGADHPDKQEIAPALLASAKVVADVIEQSVTIGDTHHAIAAGVMRREDVHAELGEIVAHRKPGRCADDDIVVFDSTGMALQDAATAALVYERARERRVGRVIAINECRRMRSSFVDRFSGMRWRS